MSKKLKDLLADNACVVIICSNRTSESSRNKLVKQILWLKQYIPFGVTVGVDPSEAFLTHLPTTFQHQKPLDENLSYSLLSRHENLLKNTAKVKKLEDRVFGNILTYEDRIRSEYDYFDVYSKDLSSLCIVSRTSGVERVPVHNLAFVGGGRQMFRIFLIDECKKVPLFYTISAAHHIFIMQETCKKNAEQIFERLQEGLLREINKEKFVNSLAQNNCTLICADNQKYLHRFHVSRIRQEFFFGSREFWQFGADSKQNVENHLGKIPTNVQRFFESQTFSTRENFVKSYSDRDFATAAYFRVFAHINNIPLPYERKKDVIDQILQILLRSLTLSRVLLLNHSQTTGSAGPLRQTMHNQTFVDTILSYLIANEFPREFSHVSNVLMIRAVEFGSNRQTLSSIYSTLNLTFLAIFKQTTN